MDLWITVLRSQLKPSPIQPDPTNDQKPRFSPTPLQSQEGDLALMASKPSIAAAESTTIEDLFSNLNRYVQESKFDQVVKVADQVLARAPGDEDAVRCKVVALIKSDAIDQALSAIAGFEALPIDLKFYKV